MDVTQAQAFVDTLEKLPDGQFEGLSKENTMNPKAIARIAVDCMTVLGEKKDNKNLQRLEKALTIYSEKTKTSALFSEIISNIHQIQTKNKETPKKAEKDQKEIKAVHAEKEELLSFMPNEVRGLVVEYVSDMSSITPLGLEEIINLVNMFIKNPKAAKMVWREIAKELERSNEKILACVDVGQIINLLKEKVAAPLLAVCTRFQGGDEFLTGIKNLSHFEQAKYADEWIRTKPEILHDPGIFIEGWLDLKALKLEHLPSAICECEHITILYLGENLLKKLPSKIGQLKLKALFLHSNQFEIMPDLSQLVSIEKLNIANNAIKEIPSSIDQLKKLKYFNANINQIQKVPVELYNLEQLETLSLSGNKITRLPEEDEDVKHHFLKKLKTLHIENNPGIRIPNFLLALEKQGLRIER